MKVGFTGTQRWMTDAQLKAFGYEIYKLAPTQFHHGDCIGADAQAHMAVRMMGAWIIKHPPLRKEKQAFMHANEDRPYLPYLVRNKNIVNETDMLLACPGENAEQLRSGTWSTVRYARKLGRPIKIVFPDGSVKTEEGKPLHQASRIR